MGSSRMMQVLGFLAALGGVGHWSRRALEVLQRSLETLQELCGVLVEGVKVMRTMKAELKQHLEALKGAVEKSSQEMKKAIYELERSEGFLSTMSLRLTFMERRM